VPGARRFVRTVVRALALAPTMLMLMAGMAWADVQFTPAFSNTPGDANCTLHAPNTQCGQWTYWMAVGAIILGLVALVGFVVAYFRFAPRFQVQEPATAGGVARAGGARARPLEAPPPAVARPAGSSPAAAPAAQAEAAPAASAVAVAEPPPAQDTAEATAPAATEPRPPSPRHEPVEPDQETYDRILAEQLAKGTDRRVAEGRAKAAALKAAREQAAS